MVIVTPTPSSSLRRINWFQVCFDSMADSEGGGVTPGPAQPPAVITLEGIGRQLEGLGYGLVSLHNRCETSQQAMAALQTTT